MLFALLACTGPKDDDTVANAFAIEPAELGPPLAASSGFDATDGDVTGRALDAVLPVFGAEDPLWNTPMAVWALLQQADVKSDACPQDVIDDGATVHEGDCRSSFGYEFAGDVSEEDWDDGSARRSRLEADVEVTGDVDDPVFERVKIQGFVERALPDDEAVDVHYDINLRLEVEGYEHPELATAWSEWVVTGSAESKDDAWVADLAVEVAGSGGMEFASADLVPSACPIEMDGQARLAEGVTALFEGVDACDACARVTTDSGETLACAPD